MASVKLLETKDGRKFWQISVSRGYGVAPYKTRFYWPMKADGKPMSLKKAESELEKAVAEFARACAAGEVQSRAEAKEKAAQAAAEAAAEAAKLKTVRQYGDGVFFPEKEATISENTRASYRMFLDKYIFPALGDVVLTEVSTAMIKKLISDFQAAGYSHASTIKLYNILNGLFTMAYMDDSIADNPMGKVKTPQRRKDEVIADEIDKAYTEDEISAIFDYASQEPLKWNVYIHLAYETAARRGELCGLKWADIDFDSGSIAIQRNLQYTAHKGIYIANPKNGKPRTVYIGKESIELLKQLREAQASECISQWVFTQDGIADPMFPQSPTRFFAKFGERHGIKDFHPHKLRHSFASVAITNGADVASVSEALGHSDKATTLKMYTHASEESIKRAAQTARDALKRTKQA